MSQNAVFLTNDHSEIPRMNSERILVAIPLLAAYITNYFFHFLRMVKKQHNKTQRLNDLSKRLFMFGVASLFSLNFLQSSAIMTGMAWITLICVMVNHCFVFLKDVDQRHYHEGMLAYYILLMIWFVAILGCYFYDFNNAG